MPNRFADARARCSVPDELAMQGEELRRRRKAAVKAAVDALFDKLGK